MTAKTVVWFGYSHNIEALKQAIPLIEELNLNLIIISNDDPIANRWGLRDIKIIILLLNTMKILFMTR